VGNFAPRNGVYLQMEEGTKNELVSARLVRVPWWRAALSRLGADRGRRHQETLDRLAERDVTDTVGEADVKTWLSMLEGESQRAPEPRNRRQR
jgi:hypothetical protein